MPQFSDALSVSVLPLLLTSIVWSGQDVPNDEMHQRALGPPVDYLSEIKPILVRRCYSCHGPDGETREAHLRLDQRADATHPRYGDFGVIVPGDAEQSELLARIRSDDDELRMPPDGEPLTQNQIELIERWIQQGAPYAEHWSFEEITDPPVPSIADRDQQLVRDPIDLFVLARLEENGLHAAGDAPPAVQLRRLSYDLTGLPPAYDDIVQFERNPTDDMWNRFVDQYLASENYGERWARHWLDLVRYAETYGHEFDYPIYEAWRYRDYVIRALNADVPYDEFLTEHIAGDLVPPRVDPETGMNEAVLATGFWHLHQGVHGPVDVRLDELDRVDNQIDVFSKAFLGLTVSCARCHDHKFDPISQADYYGLAGYLKSSRRNQTYIDPHGQIEVARETIRQAHADFAATLAEAKNRAVDSELEDLLTVLARSIAEDNTGGSFSTEVMFEDFESGDFAGWVVEGNAFKRGAQDIDSVRDPFKPYTKSRCVNTCDDRPGGDGDDGTGTLTSPTFVIEYPVLRFALSGGKFPGETCLDLLIDGTVVDSVHGQNDVVLREIEWDVSEWLGKEAQIQIVDTRTGGWGHIVVDDIRFGMIPGFSNALTSSVEAIQRETGLSQDGVHRWLGVIHDRPNRERPWDVPLEVGPEPEQVFDDGSGSEYWFSDGHAWPDGPHPRLSSGLDDDRFKGILRSRTFPLTHEYVIFRLRGRGTIRVVVNGFIMDQFNPLLFEGLKQDINASDWEVRLVDVSSYTGQRAWIELIDDTDGMLEVDWIAFDDRVDARVASSTSLDDPVSWSDDEVARWLTRHNLYEHLPSSALAYGRALSAKSSLGFQTVKQIPRVYRALALQDGLGEDEFVLIRGNHGTPDQIAPRKFIEALSVPMEDGGQGSRRDRLANAVTAESNPLTSRVMVNRLWHHLMGQGIVHTTDDFGALGAMPTHPYLLDHLATDFSKDYSIKRMIKRIVQSSTYRRSSTPIDESVVEVDPNNNLLAMGRVRRLQGEAIRDAMLQIAGRLDSQRYGRPVPIHLTPFMTGRGRPGRTGPLDGAGRRSIYLEVRRNFPIPFLAVFDLPIPTTTIGKRNVSNVPAQALAIMNDPFVHEMSHAWATKFKKTQHHVTADELSLLWHEALSREPSPTELEFAQRFLEEQGGGDDALTALCHAIFNTKEFTYLN